jgi:hypothetical protein
MCSCASIWHNRKHSEGLTRFARLRDWFWGFAARLSEHGQARVFGTHNPRHASRDRNQRYPSVPGKRANVL